MKIFSTFTFALATLCLPTMISADLTSIDKSLSPNTNAHGWHFELYHNKHCAGIATVYKGRGSTGCRNDVPDDAAQGYVGVSIDPTCTIKFYKDPKCSRKHKATDMHTATNKCNKVRGLKHNIKSFKIKC